MYLQVVVIEESKIFQDVASVVCCHSLQSVNKLHFKPNSSILAIHFRSGPPLMLNLKTPQAADSCVEHIRNRMAR